MSGIVAVTDANRRINATEAIARMCAGLAHRPWYVVETWSDAELPVALGRVGIGVYNRAPQPARSDDGDVVAFLTGRLFDTDDLRRDLAVSGPPPVDDAELIARLYRQRGAEFAAALRGEFVAAIWDRRLQQLVISNDRFGFYPTYIAAADGRLFVAPEVKAITAAPGFVKRLDRTALAQYMRFQVPLGARTFFEGVSLLPPAAVCRHELRSGTTRVECYWQFGSFEAEPAPSFSRAVDECGDILAGAVARAVSGGARTGLFLSGGLDSRLLLGLHDRANEPLKTFTYGRESARDVAYARRIARARGCENHWFPLADGRWVAEHVDLDLELAEGMHGWIHAHGVSTLPAVRAHADVVLTGWDGGTVVGGWRTRLPSAYTDADDLDTLAAREFQRFNQLYTWPGLDEGEERALYAEGSGNDLVGRALDSFRQEMSPYMALRPDLRAEMFYLRNHCFRLTQHSLTLLRSHVDVLSPFFDFELVRYLYSRPPALRGYRTLLRELLQRRAPELTWIPDARDDAPPTPRAGRRRLHWLMSRLATRVNAHVARVFPEHATLYADYEDYLRRDLRAWGEEILLGPRLAARGLFRPSFLRSLWERMQSRVEPDIIGKLAPIMTYELMLRRYWDED